MAENDTQRTMDVLTAQPGLIAEFLMEFAQKPRNFGVEPEEGFEASPAEVMGPALGLSLLDLDFGEPSLADVESDDVDWPAVWRHAESLDWPSAAMDMF